MEIFGLYWGRIKFKHHKKIQTISTIIELKIKLWKFEFIKYLFDSVIVIFVSNGL